LNRKKRFQKKVITAEIVTDVRFLVIHLVNAERAWSHAMQIKDEIEDVPHKCATTPSSSQLPS
jgi:signal recognition particle subunit SRP68